MSSIHWYERGLWQKPRLIRGMEVNNLSYEKERDMVWTELFFDLVFVTSVTRLGESVSSDAFLYILAFLTLFQLWVIIIIFSIILNFEYDIK